MAAANQTLDSPTDSGTTIGNYCTGSSLTDDSEITLSEGGLKTSTSTSWKSVYGTMAVTSGKWYWEGQFSATTSNNEANRYFGVVDATKNPSSGSVNTNGWVGYLQEAGSSQIIDHGSSTSITGQTAVKSDYWAVALDMDAGKIWFAKNNSWLDIGSGAGNPATAANPAFTNLLSTGSGIVTPGMSWNTDDNGGTWNFGQLGFQYTPPSGFLALCTANLPAPAILDPRLHFQVQTWAGNGGNDVEVGDTLPVDLTSTGFMQWVKNRTNAAEHDIADDLRLSGATHAIIYPDSSLVESASGEIDAPSSDHMKMNNALRTNHASNNYVGWCWVGDTYGGSSNSNGTITATVNANATAGFSIATYTGTGANATVGHGLSAAPDMILVKCRDATRSWKVYHSSIASDPATDRLQLDTDAALYDDATQWNDTVPSATVFNLGSHEDANGDGDAFVAYCWTEVLGYSDFGSYLGTGDADGPFVYTGFKPAWIMVKRVNTTGNWVIFDNKRSPINPRALQLHPNLTNADGAGNDQDFSANGWKVKTTGSDVNGSGGTYIYAAFAEHPFGGSGVAQARAGQTSGMVL